MTELDKEKIASELALYNQHFQEMIAAGGQMQTLILATTNFLSILIAEAEDMDELIGHDILINIIDRLTRSVGQRRAETLE